MAYQLQPGLSLVENPAVPTNSATDDVFVYPQPSSVSMGAAPIRCYTAQLTCQIR